MAKRNRSDYSSALPVIKPADIAPATAAVLTCIEVEEREFDNGKRLQLTFDEFPEHVYFLNVTGIDSIEERLGDDDDNWIGSKIPLVVVNVRNPATKKMQEVLHVADPEKWDDLLARNSSKATKNSDKKAAKR